ncbi:MAG: hypothetical protein WC082_08555 [Victivallales bacterium]
MYSVLPSFILGFHGCDKNVGESVLAGKSRLQPSENSYDWLGHGMYFWENNPQRALEYAEFLKHNPKRNKGKIETPFVIGAIIDLGRCLNLTESKSIGILKQGYELLTASSKIAEIPLPQNKGLLRNLDCAVINMIHEFYKKESKPPFDSVRGLFLEGEKVYEGAGFFKETHIQICVRNPNCIKGYFRVIEPDFNFPIP